MPVSRKHFDRICDRCEGPTPRAGSIDYGMEVDKDESWKR